MKTASGIILQNTGLNAQSTTAPAQVLAWLGTMDPKGVAECISALDIKWPTEGTKCRISISMVGFELRSQVIQTMNLATGTNRHIGAPPPGTQERDLGDYCKRFTKLTLDDGS